MENCTVLDFDVLMERLGVGFAPHESHGEIVNIPEWTTQQCLDALEIVRTEILPQGRPVLVQKHPARWIYCSILQLLQPLGVQIAQHDGTTAVLTPPQSGTPGTLAYTLCRRPEGLQVHYTMPGSADRDYAVNFTNLAEQVFPPLPAGEHLFVKTLGSSAVPVGLCLLYAGAARSFWVAEPDSDVYKCAVSGCPDCRVGDECTLPD